MGDDGNGPKRRRNKLPLSPNLSLSPHLLPIGKHLLRRHGKERPLPRLPFRAPASTTIRIISKDASRKLLSPIPDVYTGHVAGAQGLAYARSTNYRRQRLLFHPSIILGCGPSLFGAPTERLVMLLLLLERGMMLGYGIHANY
jgi:hypothetical protein